MKMQSASALPFRTMIVWQDDQQVRGSRLLNDIDQLRAEHGPRLGLIGGRDGFFPGYGFMVSNAHTPNPAACRVLSPGEHAPSPLLNRGPVIYPRHVVEKVGPIDLKNFPVWYAEEDYAARAHKAGFTNIVLGVDCEHKAHGRVAASRIYQGQQVADAAAFKRVHGDMAI